MSSRLATARGADELTLDGRPVGDEVLAPGWTAYERRLAYQVHDVTELVHAVKFVQDGGSVQLVSTDDRWDPQTGEINES